MTSYITSLLLYDMGVCPNCKQEITVTKLKIEPVTPS